MSRLLSLFIAIALLAGPLAVPASADDEKLPAAGTAVVGAPTSVEVLESEPDKLVLRITRNGAFTGTLSGPFTATQELTLNFAALTFEFELTLVCTCTVAGQSGTLVMEIEAAGVIPAFVGAGEWEIVGGSGGLADIDGEGTIAVLGLTATYEGEVELE